MKRWLLALVAAAVLVAGAPLERSWPEAAPASMSAGATALDQAFTQEFAEDRRPERITFRYSNETWELDWEDWWGYRQGEFDLEGLVGKIRIRREGAAPAASTPAKETRTEARSEPLPQAWILAGGGGLLVLAAGVLVWALTRKPARRPTRAPGPPPIHRPPPLPPPPLPVPVPSRLVFHSGPLAGQAVALGQGVRVGRERDCQVVVEDGSVSRHHADLLRGGQGWILRDLGSSNGTAVNGVRIQGEVLLRGDETLVFGTVKARLEG